MICYITPYDYPTDEPFYVIYQRAVYTIVDFCSLTKM